MTRIKSAFIVISFILIANILFSGESSWELVKDKDGITIENRTIEGFKMKQLRAVCTLDAPIEVVYEVMDDSSNYYNWFGDCILQKEIKRINKNEKICYHVVDVPWPLSDRDAVARVTTKPDWKKGTVVFRVDSIRQPKDSEYGMDCTTEKEDRVRMPVMDGVFTFSRISPDKTKFVYVAIADPGIALPGWILNMFSTTQPFNTLSNLKKEIKKPAFYDKASKRHGKEFKR